MNDLVIGLISIVGTISTIIFAYLAFRKNETKNISEIAKSEGALLNDIKYIKSSIDRMEKKLDKVEVNYNSLLSRVIRLEENINSLDKRLELHITNHSKSNC
jgi:peptidoglycan hydrolase CwlO-like protein